MGVALLLPCPAELVQHYRKKSEKAQQRFIRHERELPQDHRRDPEDQAYIDSLDSVNEPAVDLAEEAIVEAASQLQLQKQQHETALAEALSEITALKTTIQDHKAVADETLKEVKAGRMVANATHDLVVNNTYKLDQCLGRPTFQAWMEQGWQALMGSVPPEESFFRPSTIWEWLNPQSFVMVAIWIGTYLDARSGSKLSRFLNVHTPGWARVFNSILLMRQIRQDLNLSVCRKSLGIGIRQHCWHGCDFHS